MPGKLKRQLLLILLGAAIVALGLVVAVRHASLDLRLLAVMGILGGLAIIVSTLPSD